MIQQLSTSTFLPGKVIHAYLRRLRFGKNVVIGWRSLDVLAIISWWRCCWALGFRAAVKQIIIIIKFITIYWYSPCSSNEHLGDHSGITHPNMFCPPEILQGIWSWLLRKDCSVKDRKTVDIHEIKSPCLLASVNHDNHSVNCCSYAFDWQRVILYRQK